ncbi:MAG: response regulator [Caldilineaceae bacterium]|nr:response regulator [Caldilineaceae bacterium]
MPNRITWFDAMQPEQGRSPQENAELDPAPYLLIVDDSRANRELLRLYLEQSACVLREAKDGREALESVMAQLPALIITDVSMPNLDGIAMTTRLRERYSARKLPIVLMSSEHGGELLAQARAAGANGFLPKPVSRRQLRTVVTRYCGET